MWAISKSDREEIERRSHVFPVGKTDESVLDIFLFIKIEVLLWGRPKACGDKPRVAGDSNRDHQYSNFFKEMLVLIK